MTELEKSSIVSRQPFFPGEVEHADKIACRGLAIEPAMRLGLRFASKDAGLALSTLTPRRWRRLDLRSRSRSAARSID